MSNMAIQFKIIAFIVVSAAFGWLTRSSLRSFRFHGLYRFLALESVLILILLNLDYWFHEPFSIRQIFSWLLLTISVFLVVHGYMLLQTLGKPDNKRNDSSLVGVEKTTKLVTGGAYRYIRHPIYGSAFYAA
jgi:protein-S-isoprenylcysteine O-methyltransferase Ste14